MPSFKYDRVDFVIPERLVLLGRRQFHTGQWKYQGYLVRLATTGKLPSILVIHENRGLNPYIEDVTR